MNIRRIAACSLVLVASAACGGKRNLHLVPEQQTDMDPKVLEKFAGEVREYVDLRGKLAGRVSPPPPSATPEQMAAQRKTLKEAIQRARKGARQGEFFKKSVEAAIRRIIRSQMSASMLKEIQQGNPNVEGVPQQSNPQIEVKKQVRLRVNGDYPDDAPFSSVPASLLLKLPPLPEQVRYRFVGPHLILRDAEANVILDYILDAIPDRSLPR